MRTVTIYNKSSGKILRSFWGPDELIALNIKQDEDYIDGGYSKDDVFVKDGKLVSLTNSEKEQRDIAEAWQFLKTQRDSLLSSTDWTQAADAPVDRAAWAAYRQALRDLPANTADPRDPQWPTPPQ